MPVSNTQADVCQVDPLDAELVFTRSGYVSKDGASQLSSIRRIGDDGRSHFSFVLSPRQSIAPCGNHPVTATDELPLGTTMSMLWKMSLGQKQCAPKFAHPFVDRYHKTFFISPFALSFTDSYKDLLNLSAYGNFLQTRYWDASIGMCEFVHREVRVVNATLAALLLRGEHGMTPSDDVNALMKAGKARGDNVGDWMTPGYEGALSSCVSSADDALAFVFGVESIGCIRDHLPKVEKPNASMSKPVRELRGMGISDALPKEADKFTNRGCLSAIVSDGHVPTSDTFVVPAGGSETRPTMGDDGYDVLAAEGDGEPVIGIGFSECLAGDSDGSDEYDIDTILISRNADMRSFDDENEIQDADSLPDDDIDM